MSKKFMNDIGLEGERRCQIFTSTLFCLTVPKSCMKEPSVPWFRKLLGSKKFEKRGGNEGVSRFSDKIFFLSVPKILVELLFSISPISGFEKG